MLIKTQLPSNLSTRCESKLAEWEQLELKENNSSFLYMNHTMHSKFCKRKHSHTAMRQKARTCQQMFTSYHVEWNSATEK